MQGLCGEGEEEGRGGGLKGDNGLRVEVEGGGPFAAGCGAADCDDANDIFWVA